MTASVGTKIVQISEGLESPCLTNQDKMTRKEQCYSNPQLQHIEADSSDYLGHESYRFDRWSNIWYRLRSLSHRSVLTPPWLNGSMHGNPLVVLTMTWNRADSRSHSIELTRTHRSLFDPVIFERSIPHRDTSLSIYSSIDRCRISQAASVHLLSISSKITASNTSNWIMVKVILFGSSSVFIHPLLSILKFWLKNTSNLSPLLLSYIRFKRKEDGFFSLFIVLVEFD